MLAQDLTAALDYLGVDPTELASLTGESLDRCMDWANDRAAGPFWLDQLVFCWCEHPDTLQIARDGAEASRKGTTEALMSAKAANRHAASLN